MSNTSVKVMYKKQESILQDEKHMAKVVSLQLTAAHTTKIPGFQESYSFTDTLMSAARVAPLDCIYVQLRLIYQ